MYRASISVTWSDNRIATEMDNVDAYKRSPLLVKQLCQHLQQETSTTPPMDCKNIVLAASTMMQPNASMTSASTSGHPTVHRDLLSMHVLKRRDITRKHVLKTPEERWNNHRPLVGTPSTMLYGMKVPVGHGLAQMIATWRQPLVGQQRSRSLPKVTKTREAPEPRESLLQMTRARMSRQRKNCHAFACRRCMDVHLLIFVVV